MLTLGIPSSGTTAIMLGVLTLYNITPGPMLFTAQPDLVWGLIASLFIGNVILLVLHIPLVGLFARMLSVPNWVLVPAITCRPCRAAHNAVTMPVPAMTPSSAPVASENCRRLSSRQAATTTSPAMTASCTTGRRGSEVSAPSRLQMRTA